MRCIQFFPDLFFTVKSVQENETDFSDYCYPRNDIGTGTLIITKLIKICAVGKGQKKRKTPKPGNKTVCKASGFKEIRSLSAEDQHEILDKCINKEIEFAKINSEGVHFKRMKEVQLAFMDGVGVSQWEDAVSKQYFN